MMESDFTSYLRNQRCLQESTVTSRISNCRRVEQYEGNLDEHYDNDTMRTLLSRLIYSADDEGKNLPRGIKFRFTGIYETAQLR